MRAFLTVGAKVARWGEMRSLKGALRLLGIQLVRLPSHPSSPTFFPLAFKLASTFQVKREWVADKLTSNYLGAGRISPPSTCSAHLNTPNPRSPAGSVRPIGQGRRPRARAVPSGWMVARSGERVEGGSFGYEGWIFMSLLFTFPFSLLL